MLYGQFLGYRKGSDGKPEIVPEEAELVRRIYKEFISGMAASRIAKTLTKEGVPTPGGRKKWQISVIESILSKLRTTDLIRCTLQQPLRPLEISGFPNRGCIFAL
jgi:DNA invertase Pin-like site-specific DNA recombinase